MGNANGSAARLADAANNLAECMDRPIAMGKSGQWRVLVVTVAANEKTRISRAAGTRKRIGLVSAACLSALAGCHRSANGVAPPSIKPTVKLATPMFAPAQPTVAQEPLPLEHRTREQREAGVLASMRKRVWGRRASLPDIRRIANDVYPLICEAVKQPQVTPCLQSFANDNGLTLEQAREKWISIEEADLLLEAGGNPEDVSSAGATGVAQWMPNIAREQGLHVDLARSRQLTARIDALNWRIAWLTYLARPDADPNAPGKPLFAPSDLTSLPALQQERETLRAQRVQFDDRYDPRKAIFAHARYLLRLYAKFPSSDWIFQAYHGGEWGAKKEIWYYLGQKPASYEDAIRAGNGGQPLTYEDVYFGITPIAHIPAFRYIYGRGDDHRRYWWKLRSSQAALALYHLDPKAFEQEWTHLLPGRRTEAVWYPDAPAHAVADLDALKTAQGKGLLPVTSAGKHHRASRPTGYRERQFVCRASTFRQRRAAAGSRSLQTGGRQNAPHGWRPDPDAGVQRAAKGIAPAQTLPAARLSARCRPENPARWRPSPRFRLPHDGTCRRHSRA